MFKNTHQAWKITSLNNTSKHGNFLYQLKPDDKPITLCLFFYLPLTKTKLRNSREQFVENVFHVEIRIV